MKVPSCYKAHECSTWQEVRHEGPSPTPLWSQRRLLGGVGFVFNVCITAPSQTNDGVTRLTYAQAVPDENVTNVGSGYKGLDPKEVAHVLEATGIPKPKSPYETTIDYQRRIASIPNQSISDGLVLSGRLAFVLNGPGVSPYGLNGQIKLNYDADQELLGVTVQFDEKNFLVNEIYPLFKLRSAVVTSDHYVGTNAFGASADVVDSLSESFGLSLDNGTWLTPRTLGEPALEPSRVTFPLQISSVEAQELVAHLRVLLICTLTSPWIQRNANRLDPTIQNPSGLTEITKYLHVAPQEVWIFDERSGRILFKFNDESLKTERLRIARERRAKYPLTLEVSSPSGWWFAFLKYQYDDQPEQSGRYNASILRSAVPLPLLIEAKSHILLRFDSKHDYEYTAGHLVFKLNGAVVRPKWHTEKNSDAHSYLVSTTFQYP